MANNWLRFEVRDGIPGNYAIPERVLAECEAKRRIVEQCAHAIEKYDGERIVELAWDTLIDLAQVYADHPDFREEWRVDA